LRDVRRSLAALHAGAGFEIGGACFRGAPAAEPYLTNNVFEATRGCVHPCEFCVVPTAWGRKPYQKPVHEVVADIRQHGARKLIFVDLNIIADRRYAVELFTALIPLRLQWYGLSTVLLADDDELLALAQRSGCAGLLMGLESLSTANLKGNRKGFNSPEHYARVVERLHAHGIALQGALSSGSTRITPTSSSRRQNSRSRPGSTCRASRSSPRFPTRRCTIASTLRGGSSRRTGSCTTHSTSSSSRST
jgi:hypothetical protein